MAKITVSFNLRLGAFISKRMMKTQLELTFIPVIGNLMHIPALKSQFVRYAITDCSINAITIKQLFHLLAPGLEWQ